MGPTKHVLVPLAEGFEELEAVCLIDVLRRAEVGVVVAGLVPGPVRGAHGISVGADCALQDLDPCFPDAIVLPGGMSATLLLMADERVLALVRRLHAAGIVEGVPVTSHPSVRRRLVGAEVLAAPRVVKSGNVWTSQGPGTALEFALSIVEELCGGEIARRLGHAMLVA
jgi:4-methyl-5(b-hydroxyethyl)-thiazole monophosphate biosynthesis